MANINKKEILTERIDIATQLLIVYRTSTLAKADMEILKMNIHVANRALDGHGDIDTAINNFDFIYGGK